MQRGYRDELQGGVLQLALEAGRHVRRSEIYCLRNPHPPHQPTFLLDFYLWKLSSLQICFMNRLKDDFQGQAFEGDFSSNSYLT